MTATGPRQPPCFHLCNPYSPLSILIFKNKNQTISACRHSSCNGSSFNQNRSQQPYRGLQGPTWPGPLFPFRSLSSSFLLSLPQTRWPPCWFWKVSCVVMLEGLCPLPGHSFQIIFSNSPNSFQSFIKLQHDRAYWGTLLKTATFFSYIPGSIDSTPFPPAGLTIF